KKIIKEYAGLNTEEEAIELIEAQSYIYKKLDEEIENLPTAQKEVLKLRYFEGLDLSQIAERQKTSYNTVRNQLHSAMKTLRLSFKDDEWRVILLLLTCGSLTLN